MAGRRLIVSLTLALAAVLSVGAPSAWAGPASSLLAPPGACGTAADRLDLDPGTAQKTMRCLTNYARIHDGLRPLAANATLNGAGAAKLAADISCAEFTHTPCNKPFTVVFGRYVTGANSYTLGENIAWGTGSFGTPRATMNAWLNSPEHRQNILSPAFHELGIGYLSEQSFQGTTGATLWSQEFGTRSPKR